MSPEKPRKSPPDNGAAGRWPWKTQALLGLAAGVVLVLAIWMTLSPPRRDLPGELAGPGSRPVLKPGQSQADQVIATSLPLMKAKQYGPARDLMAAYVRSNPADMKVRPMLADALHRLGQSDQAEHVIDDLLRLDAQSAQGLWMKGILVRQRKGENWQKFFQHAVDSPRATPEIYTLFALEMLSQRKLDKAEEYYRKAVKSESWNVQALGGLGELLVRKGQFEEAERMLTEAVRHEKRDRDLWRLLAEARKNVGRLEEAMDAVSHGLALHRGGAELILKGEIGLLMAGQAQSSQPDKARSLRLAAAEDFASACDFPPQRGEASFKAARTYYFLEQYAMAMKYIDMARVAMPGHRDVAVWEQRIEDARFPRPGGAVTRPSRLLEFLPEPTLPEEDKDGKTGTGGPGGGS